MTEPQRDRLRPLRTRFGPETANVPGRPAPAWMFYALAAGGAWHVLIGLMMLAFPAAFVADPPLMLRVVGGLVLAWGVGLIGAASDAFRYWPTLLTGVIGLVSASGVLIADAAAGSGTPVLAAVAAGVALAWAAVFVAVLRAAWRDADEYPTIRRFYPFMKESVLQTAVTHRGDRLLDLSNERPLLLVFLRHSGCTFCREAHAVLGEDRARIERLGTRIVLVHMGDPDTAEQQARQHGLDGIDMVSNEDQSLYWAFGLRRGRFKQLYGPKVWWRGFVAGVLRRLGVGAIDGDGYQMPGVFLFSQGRVERAYIHRSAADCPDYVALAMPAPPADTDVVAAVASR